MLWGPASVIAGWAVPTFIPMPCFIPAVYNAYPPKPSAAIASKGTPAFLSVLFMSFALCRHRLGQQSRLIAVHDQVVELCPQACGFHLQAQLVHAGVNVHTARFQHSRQGAAIGVATVGGQCRLGALLAQREQYAVEGGKSLAVALPLRKPFAHSP